MDGNNALARLENVRTRIVRTFAAQWDTRFGTGAAFLLLALALRFGFLFEVVSRLYRGPTFFLPNHFALWVAAIVGFAIYVLVLCILTWYVPLTYNSTHSRALQIVFDLFFFSLFYFLNGDPESNLYFTFLVPLLIATRYFPTSVVLIVFGLVIFLIGSILMGLDLVRVLPALRTPLDRLFFIRTMLFTCITVPLVRSEYMRGVLVNQRQKHLERMNVLAEQGVELAKHTNINSLLHAAVQTALQELHAETACVFLLQDGRYQRKNIAPFEESWFSEESYAPGEGITGQVGYIERRPESGNPIRINQVSTDARVIDSNLEIYKRKLRSGHVAHICAVPLRGSNRIFGILRVVNKLTLNGQLSPTGFTEDDQDMLTTIATQLALAYGSKRREEKAQAVFDVHTALNQTFDPNQVCQRIADAIVRVQYRACCVLLRMPDDRLRIEAQHGFGEGKDALLESLKALHQERLTVLQTGLPNVTANLQSSSIAVVANWSKKYDLCSVLRLPLLQKEQVIGILEIYSKTDHIFYKEEQTTLELFAAQATMAIVNARLSEQNREQIAKLKMLTDIISRIMQANDQNTVLEIVASKAAALLESEDCSIFWVNPENNTLDLQASVCIPPSLFRKKVSSINDQPRAGFPAWVAAVGKALQFTGNEYEEHVAWNEEFSEDLVHLPSKQCSSLLVYPILDQNKNVLGVIKVENKQGVHKAQGFMDADYELLELLTTQIVIAVEKLEDIRRLKHLHDAARLVTQAGEQQEVLKRIAQSAWNVVRADIAVLCPYDAETEVLLVEEAIAFGEYNDISLLVQPRASAFAHEVLYSHSGYTTIDNMDYEPDKLLSSFIRQEGVRSLIAVSLRVRNQPVGILYCYFRRPFHFAPHDIRNVQAFGELAAIAIQNTKLFTRLKRTVQELNAVQQLTNTALTKVDLNLDSVLDVVIDTICGTLGYEFCTVSLVDEAEKSIATRKGRNIDEAWIKQARHRLESDDIQSYIVRTGETIVISGWDTRLDRDLYEQFVHERLVRVFTPIRSRRGIIGTIEAGYDRTHKAVITKQEQDTLTRYLEQVALVIQNARLLEQERVSGTQLRALHKLSSSMSYAALEDNLVNVLQSATQMAIAVAGKGSAVQICLTDAQTLTPRIQEATSTDVNALHEHVHTAEAIHELVMTSGERVIQDGFRHPGSSAPSVCIALKTGTKVLGRMCIVYDRDHWFSAEALKILDICAAQVAIAIHIAHARQELTHVLKTLSHQITNSYHRMIGPQVVYVSHVLDVLLAGKLGPLADIHMDRLSKARHTMDRLHEHVRRLLTVRELEEGTIRPKFEPTAIGILVDDVLAKMKNAVESKQLNLRVDVDVPTCKVTLDVEKISAILEELLSNAIKFTPSNGFITLMVREQQDHVLLICHDSGRGIAPADHERIFDRDIQIPPLLKPKEAGAGLGLYLVQIYVRMHGGTITVASHLGEGSRFTVMLPKTPSAFGG